MVDQGTTLPLGTLPQSPATVNILTIKIYLLNPTHADMWTIFNIHSIAKEN